MILNTTTMSKITEMMIRKPSLKYRDVRNYEGEYYDWAAGEHLLKKGTSVHELFHPLEHDIRFIKDEQGASERRSEDSD